MVHPYFVSSENTTSYIGVPKSNCQDFSDFEIEIVDYRTDPTTQLKCDKSKTGQSNQKY